MAMPTNTNIFISANYLAAVLQSLLVVHLNAKFINCKCLRGADAFEELVDGVHEAGDLHLMGEFVNLRGQLGILEISLVPVEEPFGQIKIRVSKRGSEKFEFVPHGAFEDFRGDSVQRNGFVGTLLRLFEVAEQHFGKHAARDRQQQLVALDALIETSTVVIFI
jgi:hypothetical protein